MKILWVCSIMLPRIASSLQMSSSNKEGWITGLSDMIVEQSENNHMKLAVCFPVPLKSELLQGEVDGISYFTFHEDTSKPWKYEETIETELALILETYQPDLIHVFGTEFPHSLAMANVVDQNKPLLVGLQGLCFAIAPLYALGVPEKVQKQFLFRDLLKMDNIHLQQKKFYIRGRREKELLNKITHVTGRTDFDRKEVLSVNSRLKYHFMNEILRPEFYGSRWSYEKCEPFRIFMSQGNYPLKGLHFMLEAMPALLEKYPEIKLYIAGDKITNYETLKDKIKISSYGKFLLRKIKEHKLESAVVFLGKLDSKEMCQEYLKANVYLSASTLENSPNSVGEAMLLGMPVVSSDVGGVRNMLEHLEEGYLYQTDNKEALIAAIGKVFDMGKGSRELGNRARAHAMVTHDKLVNYHRLLDIYHNLLQDM